MTVAALPRTATYKANGVTAAFPIPFQFLTAAGVKVWLRDFAGVLTPAAVTITGGGGGTGTATFAVPPPTGVRVVIKGRQAIDQPMVYTTGDRFPAKSHERALDRGAIVDQELRDDADAAAERIARLEASAQQFWFDPGVDPDLNLYFDPGVDPVIDLRFDPGEF